MLSFNEILEKIETRLSQLPYDRQPAGLYEPIRYILSLGGKRIRPAFALMAYNIYKEEMTDDILFPALGLEIFHNFTLMHDDLMDEADKRRSKPTVHKVWNPNTAILSGDAMLIAAYRLIAQTNAEVLPDTLNLFSETALEICEGQQYDMEFESRTDVTEKEYLEMIRLKTAVLLACAFKTGAQLGGAPATDAEHLYQFGICIGMAFQLQDDLLDVYGDPATFGKNIGGDILCNKKTFLLINAFRLASPEQQQTLRHWIEANAFNPQEKIAAVMAIYTQLGLKELSEIKIRTYFEQAMTHLEALTVPAEKLTVVKDICSRLIDRRV